MTKSVNRLEPERLSPVVRPVYGTRLTRRTLLGGAAASGVLAGLGGSLAYSPRAAVARQDGAIAIFGLSIARSLLLIIIEEFIGPVTG